jgi:hypothetical protein
VQKISQSKPRAGTEPLRIPLLGTSGAACRWEGWLGNTLQQHEIGHDPCWAERSRSRLGMGAPRVPHRFLLIAHYRTRLTTAPDPRSLALRLLTRLQRLKSYVRASILL